MKTSDSGTLQFPPSIEGAAVLPAKTARDSGKSCVFDSGRDELSPSWRAMRYSKPDARKGEALQVRVASSTGSPLDELLAAVDIVRCSGDGCVRHDVDGERGDVGRADHATDWQSGAQLLATRV